MNTEMELLDHRYNNPRMDATPESGRIGFIYCKNNQKLGNLKAI